MTKNIVIHFSIGFVYVYNGGMFVSGVKHACKSAYAVSHYAIYHVGKICQNQRLAC